MQSEQHVICRLKAVRGRPKLTTVDPQERSTLRSGVRSAMRAASQLPGKGPTDVDDAPAPANNQKSDYDMMTSFFLLTVAHGICNEGAGLVAVYWKVIKKLPELNYTNMFVF